MKKKEKFKFSAFVSYTVDKGVKATVRKLLEKNFSVESTVRAFLDEDYKWSAVYDEDRQCYTISVFQPHNVGDNAGLILAAHHADFVVAAALAYTLHNEVFNKKWPTPAGDNDQYNW